MFITIELKETYLDSINGTFTVELYKNWYNFKRESFIRLLYSIPSVPKYQALAMKKAVNITATDTKFIPKDNVVYIIKR